MFIFILNSVLGILVIHDKKVITYASLHFNVREKNYPTHDLELLVVVFTLKMLLHFLYGVKCEVFVYNYIL